MVVATAPAPYRPSPWEESCNFYYWDHKDAALSVPAMTRFSYTKSANAKTGRARLDLSADRAWGNRRFWGLLTVSDILPTPFPHYPAPTHDRKVS